MSRMKRSVLCKNIVFPKVIKAGDITSLRYVLFVRRKKISYLRVNQLKLCLTGLGHYLLATAIPMAPHRGTAV